MCVAVLRRRISACCNAEQLWQTYRHLADCEHLGASKHQQELHPSRRPAVKISEAWLVAVMRVEDNDMDRIMARISDCLDLEKLRGEDRESHMSNLHLTVHMGSPFRFRACVVMHLIRHGLNRHGLTFYHKLKNKGYLLDSALSRHGTVIAGEIAAEFAKEFGSWLRRNRRERDKYTAIVQELLKRRDILGYKLAYFMIRHTAPTPRDIRELPKEHLVKPTHFVDPAFRTILDILREAAASNDELRSIMGRYKVMLGNAADR